jgi:hypothetical protein
MLVNESAPLAATGRLEHLMDDGSFVVLVLLALRALGSALTTKLLGSSWVRCLLLDD